MYSYGRYPYSSMYFFLYTLITIYYRTRHDVSLIIPGIIQPENEFMCVVCVNVLSPTQADLKVPPTKVSCLM